MEIYYRYNIDAQSIEVTYIQYVIHFIFIYIDNRYF